MRFAYWMLKLSSPWWFLISNWYNHSLYIFQLYATSVKCVDTVMIKGSVLTGQTVKLVTGNEFSKRDWVFAGVGRSIIYRFPRSICNEGGGAYKDLRRNIYECHLRHGNSRRWLVQTTCFYKLLWLKSLKGSRPIIKLMQFNERIKLYCAE